MYTPFQFNDEALKKMSSSVITTVSGWQDSSLLIPHEAIRVMLDAFVHGLVLDSVSKVVAFEKLWTTYMYGFIHHHHDIEEETYMPWIYEKVAAPSGLVIEHDHQTLIAEMDEISRVAAEKTVEAGARLPELLQKLASGMSAHLANEETYVPQMLRDSGYTMEDEQAVVGKVMQSLSPEAFATMMPLIFYAMDKAGGYGPLTSERFFSTLPPPVQEAYPAWKAAFQSDFLAVLEDLSSASPTVMKTVEVSVVAGGAEADALIDGFKTKRADTQDVRYQADPAFPPDKARLWKTDESHDGWVHAHNAIRFEIGELKRVLEALSEAALAEWQVQAVQAWWANHAVHVHEHHRNEDDVLNPVLRTRIAYPEKLEADHVELVAAMDAIGACVKALSQGDSLAGLRALWARYESLMLPHLHEEEQVGLPLVRAYFTPAEIEKIVATFMKGGDPVSLGSFVHVMGHKKDAQQFMKENGIPPFVWHIPGKGFKALRTLYRTKQQVHIDSLLAGEPVKSTTKKHAKENAAKAAKVQNESISLQCALSPSKRANVMGTRYEAQY